MIEGEPSLNLTKRDIITSVYQVTYLFNFIIVAEINQPNVVNHGLHL